MEDEVRITIIATGFASEEPFAATSEQIKQMTNIDQLMNSINKEAELDVPPFLRDPALRQAASNGNGRTGTY